MVTMSKRDRLIEAAMVMFYQQGVTRSTLADIAQQAQVPLGNVYYHFRTKDSLIEAVLETHVQDLRVSLASWEGAPDPRQRLLSLLASSRDNENMLARYGCPHGSLCQELDKDDNPLVSMASQIFQVYLDWAEVQFRQLGMDEQDAKDYAVDLLSSLQGAFLLTSSFRSPAMLERKLQRLEAWIRSL